MSWATARPADHEAAQRRQRHDDGDEQQHRLGGTVGRIQAQPVVQADAAVQPHEQQQRALQDGARRPQAGQLVQVVVLHAEEDMRDPRIDDMRQQQEGNSQPERDLDQLPRRQAQRRSAWPALPVPASCG